MKTCPECAEDVKAAARVCRFCGHRFAEESGSSERAEATSTQASGKRRRWPKALAVGTAVLVAVAAIGILLAKPWEANNSSGDAASQVEEDLDSREQFTGEEPSTTTTDSASEPPEAEVGEAAQSGDITMTVMDASASESLSYKNDYGDAKTKTAEQGGRYVSVETRITNDTSEGIDITCSLPIDAKVIDESGKEYDPIEELYSIPGNPECNDMLQPGFKDKTTWVYLVPKDAEISSFAFADVVDFESENEAAQVALPTL